MRHLTANELEAARKALCGTQGPAFADAMFHLSLDRPVTDAGVIKTLEELRWYSQGHFSDIGALIRDPLREYGFWLERNRRLPSEELEILNRERYRDKRVLELGSGGGCNLLSLSGIPERLVGLEPMPVYVQIGEILADLAELPAPETVVGSAEDIPFDDRQFDVVLCYSSHQYMNLHRAIAESARVLAPAGELIIVSNTLKPFFFESIERFLRGRNLGTVKYDAEAIINTLSYQTIARRIVGSSRGSTTGQPIYPSYRFLEKLFRRSGLMWDMQTAIPLPTNESVVLAQKI